MSAEPRTRGNAYQMQYDVHPDPCPDSGFSWERADKIQCVQFCKYSCNRECSEYFTTLIKEAISLVQNGSVLSNSIKDVTMETIEYGQLVRLPVQADDAAQEIYEMFDGNKVRAPLSEGGEQYEVLGAKKWPWKVKLLATVDSDLGLDINGDPADNVNYAVQLSLGKRGRENCILSSHKDKDYVIHIKVGEINSITTDFVAWDSFVVSDDQLMKSLFYQYCKGEYHWPRWERPEEELPVGLPTSRYRLESKNGAMCLLITTGKEPEWQRICGFELLRVEGVYQFDEADCGTPYVKIICRNLVNPVGEGIYYLAAEDKQRDPPMNYQFCDTEVLVDDGKLKTTADVKNLFKSFNVNLQSTIMIPDMLSCWLEQKQQDHEWPPTTTCIVRFGESVPLALLVMLPYCFFFLQDVKKTIHSLLGTSS